MYRNMQERVETLIPIIDDEIHDRIMNEIMRAEILDKGQSWVLDKDMQYTRLSNGENKKVFNSQDFFCNLSHLSLSDKNKILKKAGDKQ